MYRYFSHAVVVAALLLVSCGTKPKTDTGAQTSETPETTESETVDMSAYMPQLAVGSKAYVFELPDSAGTMHSLTDCEGSWTVVDFWASWCGDCRAEIPAVKALYDNYQPKGVKFVGISFDKEPDAWKQCLRTNELPGLQLCNFVPWRDKHADGTVAVHPAAEGYDLHWIPTLFLIAPDGTLAGFALTAADMEGLLGRSL